jgi:hypothetical protein
MGFRLNVCKVKWWLVSLMGKDLFIHRKKKLESRPTKLEITLESAETLLQRKGNVKVPPSDLCAWEAAARCVITRKCEI